MKWMTLISLFKWSVLPGDKQIKCTPTWQSSMAGQPRRSCVHASIGQSQVWSMARLPLDRTCPRDALLDCYLETWRTSRGLELFVTILWLFLNYFFCIVVVVEGHIVLLGEYCWGVPLHWVGVISLQWCLGEWCVSSGVQMSSRFPSEC